MVWVRLADDFTDHPKVIAAGPLAGWMYVCALTYANRYLTDGFIPAGQVRRLADVDGALSLADKLVDVGLWERAEGGFQISPSTGQLALFRRRGNKRIRSALRRAWEAMAHRIRPLIFARDGYICRHCGATQPPLQIDHIIPLAWGGANDPSNLQVLCKPCNTTKGDRWPG